MSELDVCENCEGFIYEHQEAAVVDSQVFMSGTINLYVHADPEECEGYVD